MLRASGWMLLAAIVCVAGCVRTGDPLKRKGDEIIAAGQMFHTRARVVTWLDANGYDAYRCYRRFDPAAQTMPANAEDVGNPNRYSQRRHLPPEVAESITQDGWTLHNLQETVDQFVIHYDVAGTSRQCFKILHDMRGLSVPFLLDLDGTIYQTLDLKERAWHAGTANDRSVGIEIANMGAYPNMKVLDEWYVPDATGWPRITFPGWVTETGIRTPNFVARPARRDPIHGTINGHELVQYDFTPEQYVALSKLTATLVRIFPKMRLDVPRDENGVIRPNTLSSEELASYEGLLGHWHVTTVKTDPGPAFDWDRVIRGAQHELNRGSLAHLAL
jgi:N-acetylmuramoyl-L-alanine amidase